MPDFIQHSKESWSNQNSTAYPGDAEMQIGCLQRIANSLEKMEKPFQQLVSERDYFSRKSDRLSNENDRLRRQVAAYQGIIKRMKKQRS